MGGGGGAVPEMMAYSYLKLVSIIGVQGSEAV